MPNSAEAFGPPAPPAAPDLQVTTLTAAKNGEKFTATVSNAGNAAAGASTTKFTLDGTQVCGYTGPRRRGSATVACTT